MIREETRKKIFNYEAPPPPGAWENIAAALGENTAPRIVKIPVWAKYAASILVVASMALIWWRTSDRSDAPIAAGSNAPVPANSGITVEAHTTDENATNTDTENTGELTRSYAQRTISYPTASHTPSPSYVTHTASLHSTGYGTAQMAQTLEKRLYREDGTDLLNENYIYLTTSDGHQVRVSRKIAVAVLAEMGITEGDPSSFETIQLSQKIRSWKAQLAESSFIPSASNMMDLLSLMEVLDKN